MTPDRWPDVSRVLDEALERPPEQWAAVVDSLCGEDDALRREVESLLALHDDARDFLRTLPREIALAAVEGPEEAERWAGTTIGPYRVIRLIALGGVGRVMLADRADGAFTQRVALKLLRPGADSPDAGWRFRTERQILATLDHPNIARLLDGGVTGDGQPWLAMEYVEGLPIDRYAEALGLGIRERLRLFLTVLDAVQYAHRSLVVHRDLKPANILVSTDGQPKLLDFGIAKLVADDASAGAAPLTRTGQRWMTPAYAAPEQILGGPVTTATDVYQLGAVLYELLTGRRPFHPEGGGTRAIEDAVLGDDPVRPSRVMASAQDGAHRAAALRGDLDAVVLKALRKAPERRYASVEALAEEIRRYLAHEPVEAREGTVWYRAGRFVARHRIGIAVAASFVVVLAASAIGLAVQQAATAQERDRANAEAAKSAQVTDYLMGLFDASDPSQAWGDTITARELLDRGVARADGLTDQPAVQATLLGVTGRVYVQLGEYDRGAALLRRSVAIERARPRPDDEQLTRSLLHLAQALELREDFVEAGTLYAEVAERASVHADYASLLRARFGLGSTLHAQHRMDEADRAFAAWESALDSLPPTPTAELAQNQVWLGQMLRYRREYPRAERLLRRGVATTRAVHGDLHAELGAALNALSSLLLVTGPIEAADSTTREAVELYRTLNPGPNRALAQTLAYRAELLEGRGDYEDAERVARDAQAMADTLFGQDRLLWGRITARLAQILHLQGENEEAERLYRGLHAWWVEDRGPDYHFTVIMAVRHAEVLAALERYPEAEALLRSSYESFRRERGEDDRWTASTAERLDRLYAAWREGAAPDPLVAR